MLVSSSLGRYHPAAKKEAEKILSRACEIDSQKIHHTIPVHASAHGCALMAPSSLIRLHGFARERSAVCDTKWPGCTRQPVVLSCDACNFDLCNNCAELAKLDLATREQRKRVLIQQEERRRQLLLEQQLRREREREERELAEKRERLEFVNKLNATKASVKVPKGANKDKNKLLKYVVWSSDGYDNDGWHSYNGAPDKEFDSSFSSKADANARVNYLFYVKNCWGLGVDEMMTGEEIDEKETAGLLRLEVCPPDSTRWTVAAVTKEAFQFLDNARHGGGDSEDSEGEMDGDGVRYSYGAAW
ncbi:hypothetical protein BDR26DRAFT_848971 [Obelidium mucronatum]|nr:hypothetical protein BDR26DRAFT_848971 [Obelidium mucronatum]